MASVRKRGNSYQITVSNGFDINNVPIRETITYKPDPTLTPLKQKKALEKFVIEFEEKVKNGTCLKGDKVTFKDFVDLWERDYAKTNIQATTLEGYKNQLNLRILPEIGTYKLNKINPLMLQTFYNKLSDQGTGAATIKRVNAIISSILHRAYKMEYHQRKPL